MTVGGAVEGVPLTGTITCEFFMNGGCSGTPWSSETVPLGDESSETDFLALGSYSDLAVYSGDENYLGSASECKSFEILKGSMTITVVINGSATVGGEVQGFSVFNGATVTYYLFLGETCGGGDTSLAVFWEVVAVGVASSPQNLTAGTYSFMAVYSGNANYEASTSCCESFTVP